MTKNALIVGGTGQLGKHVLNVFRNKGWKVLNIDFGVHDLANHNIQLDPNQKQYQQLDKIYNETG